MRTYLSVDTAEEREYAAAYVRQLRAEAEKFRENDLDKARKLTADANGLEEAIRLNIVL